MLVRLRFIIRNDMIRASHSKLEVMYRESVGSVLLSNGDRLLCSVLFVVQSVCLL
jgi:hypothetical protein